MPACGRIPSMEASLDMRAWQCWAEWSFCRDESTHCQQDTTLSRGCEVLWRFQRSAGEKVLPSQLHRLGLRASAGRVVLVVPDGQPAPCQVCHPLQSSLLRHVLPCGHRKGRSRRKPQVWQRLCQCCLRSVYGRRGNPDGRSPGRGASERGRIVENGDVQQRRTGTVTSQFWIGRPWLVCPQKGLGHNCATYNKR